MTGTDSERRDREMDLLLEAVAEVYGYDFRQYAAGSLKRRISLWLAGSGFPSFAAALPRLVREPLLFEDFLSGVTVNVSEMFRDPQVFRLIRHQVVPHLKTYPFVKIWHAGCAGGEEVYSMAILLEEEGLAGRFRIYATDIDRRALQKAKDGIYPVREMRQFTRNYRESGGTRPFSDYYTACYDHALLSPALREHVVFAAHNLASDSDFGEMHMVFCRNVLIYFQESLKKRALDLFHQSLVPGGFLCLGTKETLAWGAMAPHFKEIAAHSRVYRKRYAD